MQSPTVNIHEPHSDCGPRNARSSTAIDVHVGMKMQLRRLDIHMSRDKLAGQLGITAQQVQKYERGTNRIGASRLHQIAQVLDVPITYFFRDLDGYKDESDAEELDILLTALEDTATVKLLRMFAQCRDPRLKSRVISIVEAVVDEH